MQNTEIILLRSALILTLASPFQAIAQPKPTSDPFINPEPSAVIGPGKINSTKPTEPTQARQNNTSEKEPILRIGDTLDKCQGPYIEYSGAAPDHFFQGTKWLYRVWFRDKKAVKIEYRKLPVGSTWTADQISGLRSALSNDIKRLVPIEDEEFQNIIKANSADGTWARVPPKSKYGEANIWQNSVSKLTAWYGIRDRYLEVKPPEAAQP